MLNLYYKVYIHKKYKNYFSVCSNQFICFSTSKKIIIIYIYRMHHLGPKDVYSSH